ncbi:hypothetical protein Hanom_Chr03g00255781 [Helianthus anomalus]
MTSGSANILSFQHMPGNPTNFHQLTRVFRHVYNKKATIVSKKKRHAVSLVYRTITHTACRFLHTPQKRQKYISLHYIKGYNQHPHIPTSTREICGDDTHEPAQVCQILRTSVVLWTAKNAS